MSKPDPGGERPTAALFVTCLVDLWRPSVGIASARLIEASGCRVAVPPTQTCCGQPAYNAGDRSGAVSAAKQVITAFEAYDYTVVPSGSCAATIKVHYPKLLGDDEAWRARAQALGGKTHELTSFLTGVRRYRPAIDFKRGVAYHDACSGLRELGVKAAPRRLLGEDALVEMAEAERCCGFGGLFAVKYDAVSEEMGRRKLDHAEASGADTLAAGELGCLLHLAGLARRQGRHIRCRHVAEILADMTGDLPAIGEGR